MNKHWENLLQRDDRPREQHGVTLPIFGGPAPKRYPEGTHDQELGADLETRYRLTVTDPGRTLPCRQNMFDDER